MNYRRHIWLPVLAAIVMGFGLVVNLPPPQGIAAPPSPPAALPNVNGKDEPIQAYVSDALHFRRGIRKSSPTMCHCIIIGSTLC